jgi:hypothetical protein
MYGKAMSRHSEFLAEKGLPSEPEDLALRFGEIGIFHVSFETNGVFPSAGQLRQPPPAVWFHSDQNVFPGTWGLTKMLQDKLKIRAVSANRRLAVFPVEIRTFPEDVVPDSPSGTFDVR